MTPSEEILQLETQPSPSPPDPEDAAPSDSPQLTRVNGIGMWNSWTRNFSTPLLALLDLVDNCFDAAMEPKQQTPPCTNGGRSASHSSDDIDGERMSDSEGAPVPSPVVSGGNGSDFAAATPITAATCYQDIYCGKIEIEADIYKPSAMASASASASSDASPPPENITGVVITNNCFRPVKPLNRILEAYSSAKGRNEHGEGHFAETVGENGVGLKQGCAVLSDLSFVFVRNEKKLSLGVIAASLQKEEGVCLPSFELESEDARGLRSELIDLFGIKYRDSVGACVKEYGDGLLSVGVDRLVNHFGDIMVPGRGWGEEHNMFRVVLHELKKGSTDAAAGNADIADGILALAHTRCKELMSQVSQELPRHYLHVPENFVVNVDGSRIGFNYYQRRLVEMTVFNIRIDPLSPVSLQKDDWKLPQGPQTYPIRIFCGFDPTRAARSAQLTIYSRHSGRLVLEEEDCRATLGLSAGSTDFCQGLSVVVDDMHGYLPLNPTKQDIAWGEQANGSVHKKNLYSWISAVASLFYNFHFVQRHHKSKKALSSGVARYDHLPADACVVKTLDDSDFTTYNGISWKYVKVSGNIRCANLKAIKEIQGQDTHWCLNDVEAPEATPSPSRKKRRVQDVSADAADTSDVDISNTFTPSDALVTPGLSLQAALQAGFSDSPHRTPRACSASVQSKKPRPIVQVERGLDYQALYEEEKRQLEILQVKYEKKRDHKATAKRLCDENEKLVAESTALKQEVERLKDNEMKVMKMKKTLELERKIMLEDRKERAEQEAVIERLRRRNALLEEMAALTSSTQVDLQQGGVSSGEVRGTADVLWQGDL